MTDKLKVIKKDSHSYGQSDVTYDRPITGADFLPKALGGLDPKKTYAVINGKLVEIEGLK